MNDTEARIGRRDDGTRRVGRATAWIAAACTVLATAFGVVLATTGTSDAQSSDTGASTSTGSGDSSGDSLQAPDSAPQQGSGRAHTGSGGS